MANIQLDENELASIAEQVSETLDYDALAEEVAKHIQFQYTPPSSERPGHPSFHITKAWAIDEDWRNGVIRVSVNDELEFEKLMGSIGIQLDNAGGVSHSFQKDIGDASQYIIDFPGAYTFPESVDGVPVEWYSITAFYLHEAINTPEPDAQVAPGIPWRYENNPDTVYNWQLNGNGLRSEIPTKGRSGKKRDELRFRHEDVPVGIANFDKLKEGQSFAIMVRCLLDDIHIQGDNCCVFGLPCQIHDGTTGSPPIIMQLMKDGFYQATGYGVPGGWKRSARHYIEDNQFLTVLIEYHAHRSDGKLVVKAKTGDNGWETFVNAEGVQTWKPGDPYGLYAKVGWYAWNAIASTQHITIREIAICDLEHGDVETLLNIKPKHD